MPFSLRRCLGNPIDERMSSYRRLPEMNSVSSNISRSNGIRKSDAEGHVECKSTSSHVFKKEQWTSRYCVLRDGVLYVYKNETEESEMTSVNLRSIHEFTTFYRFVRQSKKSDGDDWMVPCCMFTFSDNYEGIIKLRVTGEEDAHYWMTNLCNVYSKWSCSGCFFQNTRIPSTNVLGTPFSYDLLGSDPPSCSGQKKKSDSATNREHKGEFLGKWAKKRMAPPPPISMERNRNSTSIDQHDVRRQLATEFVTALRRQDTMLEGRQMILRSQLEQHRSSSGLATISSMTKFNALTDHEDMSAFSVRSPTVTSSTVVESQTVRPSTLKKFGRQPKNFENETEIDDETSTVTATMTVHVPNALPTIIDDHCQSEHKCDVWKCDQPKVRDSTMSEMIYTSSISIQLGARHQTPTKTALIDYPLRRRAWSVSGYHSSSIPVVTHSTITTPKSTISYSVSSSNLVTVCTTPSTSMMGQSSIMSPISVMQKSIGLYPRSFGKKKPPPPPPPPPKTPVKCSMTPPMLPSSFLTELRAAALKRQMSSMKLSDEN